MILAVLLVIIFGSWLLICLYAYINNEDLFDDTDYKKYLQDVAWYSNHAKRPK